MARRSPRPVPDWRQVLSPEAVRQAEIIAISAHIPVYQMFNGTGSQEVIEARWQLIHWMFRAGYSYPKIGRLMKIHHSTAIYAVSKFAPEQDKGDHGIGVPVHRSLSREFRRYRDATGGS